ncbi:Transcription intermediary factor 1-alpha [Echinococcus granulosus]|nr:Transcription intermediary factor 1-alpha [Echinococcus granulosus]
MKLKESKSSHQLFECCICGSQEASRLFSQCLHTVCNDCVDKVAVSDKYICNRCNKASSKLITNGALCKMNSQNKTPNCVWCSEGGESNISQGHCEQCNQWLCTECIKGHNRMPPFRSHTINIVGDCGDKGLKCEIHPRESLELFCETCGVLTCRDCQLSVHRDHGGHRWVKEKAELLRPGLLAAMRSLEAQMEHLKSLLGTAKRAPTALLASVDTAKASLRRSLDVLLHAINQNKESLDVELDKIAQTHIDRLAKAHDVMRSLLERIDYTLRLSHCLVDNEEKDPASLVQLAVCLEERLEGLAKQVSIVSADSSVETSAAAEENGDEVRTVSGWRKSATSRAVFLPNRPSDELAQLVSSICWTSGQDADDWISKGPPEYQKSVDTIDPSTGRDGGSGGMDASGGPVDAALLSSGCTVCHSSGLLALCASCHRAFHPQCHLPRLDSVSLHSRCWTCSLCSATTINTIKSSSSPLRRIRDACAWTPSTTNAQPSTWTHEQFESGCRILLSLLCHPEAFCFTASVNCPMCSSSLLAEDVLVEGISNVEGQCGVFHGLARLRRCLEASETLAESPIEVWIRDIDAFTADICAWSKKFGVPAVTETLDKAACSLRDALDSCVESYYPAFFESKRSSQ